MNTLNLITRNTLRGAAVLAAGAGLVAALPLLAQSGAQSGGAFDRPLGGSTGAQAPAGQGTSDTTMVISSSEDGKSYTLKIHNNEISAQVDGQPVPPDRIDRKGDVVIIKDADGKTIKSFDVGIRPSRANTRTRVASPEMTWIVTPEAHGNTLALAAPSAEPPEPPPVMVGITMSDPTGPLAEHLGLTEGEAFVIDRVVDDLPAARAGVETLDIVTAIDGSRPATQDRLREVLKSKKAGDSMELTIIRKGKERKVTIELAAYDRSKLAPPGAGALSVTPLPEGAGRGEWMRSWSGGSGDELRKQLELALKSVNDSDKAAAEKALKQAMEMVEQAHTRQAERTKAITDALGDRKSIVLGDDRGQFFAMPGDREVNRRLERLGDQLEKLNHRLEEIEKRLSDKK